MKVLDWAERALADGRIGAFGFSFHDDLPLFKEIIAATDLWSFCQIQYNYMDEDYQAGTRGLHHAAEKGLGVVVMEPIRGGQLARRPPEAVAAHWAAANAEREARGLAPRTPVEWALHWVWDHPEVSTVLSGMSTMEQVEQNVAAAAASTPRSLTAAEHAAYAGVRDAYRDLDADTLHGLQVLPAVPERRRHPDRVRVLQRPLPLRPPRRWRACTTAGSKRASAPTSCIRCGECEPKCPQKIEIMDWLEKAHALLGERGEAVTGRPDRQPRARRTAARVRRPSGGVPRVVSRAFVKEDAAARRAAARASRLGAPQPGHAAGLAQLTGRVARAARPSVTSSARPRRATPSPATGCATSSATCATTRRASRRRRSSTSTGARERGRLRRAPSMVRESDGRRRCLTIVGEDEADPEPGKVSWVSPLGRVLDGARSGDTVTWRRPAGDLTVTIEAIERP